MRTISKGSIVRHPTFARSVETELMIFVLDLPSTDMIPAIVEPLFQGYEASVEVHPAMNFDDIKNAFSKTQR